MKIITLIFVSLLLLGCTLDSKYEKKSEDYGREENVPASEIPEHR